MKTASIAFLLVVLPVASAVAAPQDLANEISNEIMSPYCDGVTLHDCPSRAAADLREQIGRWAAAGWTKTEIVDELEERFGQRIHATPQRSEGLAAWALPGIALLAGSIGVGLLAKKWSSRARATEEVQPADHARVERELAAMREELS